MTTIAPAPKQVAFYPGVVGKLHAAHKIDHTPVCPATVDLGPTPWVVIAVGDTRVHPLVCKNCLKKAFDTDGVAQ